ncbi:MAG: hypothetical protein JW783_14230 [Bacteroidales bacterium]|nr:hypothetical protein [Bacteroidales bacterium]MBN2749711.1 hypothetical protein [Bacteroidales bacterium]
MDYFEIVKGINYFSFVTAFAKWIFLFFSLSVVILIVCTRLGLFKRNAKVARYLVKIYYILIPIYFVGFAIKYAPLKNSQIEINRSIDNNKQVISDFAYRFVSSVISDSILTQESSAKDIVNRYLDCYMLTMDSITKPKTSRFFEGFFLEIKRNIEYRFLVRVVESKVIDRSAEWVGISKKSGKALYRTHFNELFKEGELVEIFKAELNRYFSRYFRFAFMIFALGLLIPTIEIVLSKIIKY